MLQVSFRLKFATRHDADANVYVGYCPVLRVYSQGVTEDEAESAVVSAATLFIVTCYERDILHSALRKRGMTNATPKSLAKIQTDAEHEFISVQNFDKEFWRDVPINLLAKESIDQCLQ